MDEKYAVGLIGELDGLKPILESAGIECVVGNVPYVGKEVRRLSEELGHPVPVLVEDPEKPDSGLQRWCAVFPVKTGIPVLVIRQGDVETLTGDDLSAVISPVALNDILERIGFPQLAELEGRTFPPGAFVAPPIHESSSLAPAEDDDDELARLEREMEDKEFASITSGITSESSSGYLQAPPLDMRSRGRRSADSDLEEAEQFNNPREHQSTGDQELDSAHGLGNGEDHYSNQVRQQEPEALHQMPERMVVRPAPSPAPRDHFEDQPESRENRDEQFGQQTNAEPAWQDSHRNDPQGRGYQPERAGQYAPNQDFDQHTSQYRQSPMHDQSRQGNGSLDQGQPEWNGNGYSEPGAQGGYQQDRNGQYGRPVQDPPQNQQWNGNYPPQDQRGYGYPPNDQFDPRGGFQRPDQYSPNQQGYGADPRYGDGFQQDPRGGYNQGQGSAFYNPQQQGFAPQNPRQGFGYQQEQFVHGRQALAKTVVVLSTKGGVGKSSTSLQLAHEAGLAGLKVILIDANSGQGDLMVMLGLERSGLPTIQDASLHNDPNVAFIEPEQINYYREHDADEVTFGFVAAPLSSTNRRGDVDNLFYERVIEEARKRGDLVIIDTQILENDDKTGVVEDLWAPIIKSETGWAIAVAECSTVNVNSLQVRLQHLTQGLNIPASKFMTLFNRVDMEDMGDVVAGHANAFRGYGEVLGGIPFSREAKLAMDSHQLELNTPLYSFRVLKALIRMTRTDALVERTKEIEEILAGPKKEPNFLVKLFNMKRNKK